MIEEIVEQALKQKASDIHLVAGESIMFRIHGDLAAVGERPVRDEDMEQIMLEITNEGQREQFQQTGDLDFSFTVLGETRIRGNAFLQGDRKALALRILAERIPDPEELGIPQAVINLIDKKRGLVLVTGPTGSGKSTTLASLINQISKRYPKRIITLEDPIEYQFTSSQGLVSQREIGRDTASYAAGLKSVLRQDPDVILLGEMRDFETISTALTAAETGHLVFSTLHTNSAADTIDRIIDVFPTHQQQQIRTQLAGVLEGVVVQQLLPKLDKKGRVAAFEVMLGTTAIRSLIREDKSFQIPGTIQTNKKLGMETMDDCLVEMCRKRMIIADTAIMAAMDRDYVQKEVNAW